MSNSSNWGAAMAPGIRKWMAEEYDMYAPYYPQVFNVSSSIRQYEDDQNSTGIGKLTESSEAAPLTYSDSLQGYKTRYTHKVFKEGKQITREGHDDDLYRVLKRDVIDLANATARTYDNEAMGKTFRNAFTTTATSYGDNLPLCSTLHTRIDGGSTQSNASSTGIVLSEANLNTALKDVREILTDKGELISFMDAKPILMVTPYNKKLALEIIGSPARSATADNDLNYYFQHEDIDVLVNPWMSSLSTNSTRGSGTDLYWFILLKGKHNLNFFMRMPKEFSQEQDFDTDTLKVKAYTRFSYGWSDWRGVWGSKGDGAAYSS